MINLAGKLVLLTGAESMVGSAVCEVLQNRRAVVDKVRHSETDLLDKNETNACFAASPDYVIHLAGFNGGIQFNKKFPADIFFNTTQIGLNVLHACQTHGVKKVVSIITSCSYPNEKILYEDSLQNGYPHKSVECHAFAKRVLDAYSRQLYKQYHLNAICVVNNNSFGPCFDAETEVMTVDGLKNITKINRGDRVFTLNPDNHDVEMSKVIAIQRNKTNQWYNFQGRTVNFKVTPDHILYFRKPQSSNFIKERADYFRKIAKYGAINFASNNMPQFSKQEIYPTCISLAKFIDTNHIIDIKKKTVCDYKTSNSKPFIYIYNPADWMEFLGWYIAEGNIVNTDNRNRICIAQRKNVNSDYYQQIYDLLTRMKIPFGYAGHQFYFTSRMFVNYIKKNIGTYSHNKKIPDFILRPSFPNSLRQILFGSLMKGDGSKNGRCYTTISTQLKDDFILLCFLLGKKVSYHLNVRNKERGRNVWIIGIHKKMHETTVKHYGINIDNVTKENSYCITTDKNNIIYAGRNGRLNWIGQCDSFDPNKTKVVGGLIKKFVDAKNENLSFVQLWGSGKPRREFIFCKDIAEGLVRTLERYENAMLPLNIGSGKDYTIKELAETIADLVGYKGEIRWDTSKTDGQMQKLLDCPRMKQILDWEPEYSLKEGLQETLEWYSQTMK